MRNARSDLLDEAIDLLRQGDRLHRHFFTLGLGHAGACWEPPVDVVESGRTVTVCVALPGVTRDAVEVRSDGRRLHVIAMRRLGVQPRDAIHRLEIPYGRFERIIELPPGRYDLRPAELADGFLVLTLERLE